MDGADLRLAIYDSNTQFPDNFDLIDGHIKLKDMLDGKKVADEPKKNETLTRIYLQEPASHYPPTSAVAAARGMLLICCCCCCCYRYYIHVCTTSYYPY